MDYHIKTFFENTYYKSMSFTHITKYIMQYVMKYVGPIVIIIYFLKKLKDQISGQIHTNLKLKFLIRRMGVKTR